MAEETTINANPTQLEEQPATAAPKGGAWRAIRSLILWSHERGSIHYDVMVTLILLFVFFSPKFIKFNDQPIDRNAHPTGVFVHGDGAGGLVYEVTANAVKADGDVQAQLLRLIEPISGEVSISHYEAVTDKKGKVLSYKVWVTR